MCGRIVRDRIDQYGESFDLVDFDEARVPRRFNIAPTQVDVIVRAHDDGRRLDESRWGLVPVWAKERRIGSRMFNARAETLMEKTAFRGLVGSRRCVIPASGFYEWQRAPDRKVPLYIYRADGWPLALAGALHFLARPVHRRVGHVTHHRHVWPKRIHGAYPQSDAGDPWEGCAGALA